ncbi:MAG TPA: RHS repeat-associated core domain-containing protein, partial [Blastocatellia bacterium]
ICTQQTYDGMGRVLLTYNPFRLTGVSGPPTAPAGSPFTQNNYDLVGRVTTVTEADGSTLNSVYANNQTMVVDEGGAERISQVDGLGELTNVWEITTATDIWTTSVAFAGSLPTGVPVPAQGYLTTYTYDPLSDLINAAQATNGARDFTYDSLRRLTSATTPETGTYFQSGTTCYLYDLNSDLISKLDPRNVTTAYTYDALNRLTSRQYTIPAGTADPTPNVSYFYDGLGATSQVPNALGRLTEMTSSVSENEYTAYDPMGRVTGFTQLTNSQPYLMSYSYDLVGHVITEGYPSGRTVTNQYDQVGRIMNIQSGAEPPYQSSFSYAPFGGITSVTLGNNLVEATQYNARLQPTNIQLGPSGNLFNLTLAYNSGTDNGNLASETLAIVTNSTTNTWTQNYSYDSLNRITGATEKYNSAQTWSRSFKYDPVGNMWVSAATGIGITPATPQAQTAFNWKNQFASSTATYDPAGNLTTDLESNTYTYDAENKQAECTIINTGQGAGAPEYSYYFYDGDGHRVGKAVGTTVNGTGGTIATFVYNAGGALVAEYGGPALTDSGTSYLTTDHLSSTRVVTDSNGNPRRHDFLPFGEEINSSVDLATTGRSNVAGYVSSDDTRQKFTGKERDPESNLDYFNARYYSSPSGRFMSPDPLLIEMNRLRDPQQMNLYSYTRGNPLRFTDPLGLDITVRGDRSADYLEALQRAVSFKIALKGDKVVIEGDVDKKNLSKSDKVLLQAISDTKHHVSIDAIDGSKEPLVFFGRSDAPHSGTHTIAFGQVAMLDRDKNAGGLSSSQLVGHETVEGYAESKGDSMTDAHNYANQFFGGLDPGTGGTYTTENGMVTEITGNFTVHGTKTKESITLHLVTPVPKEDFLKGKGAPYQNYPVDVVKK